MELKLPNTVAGHWTTSEGRDMATRYLAMPRSKLGYPDYNDFSLANAVFLAGRNDLTLVSFQGAAKERIRWLSVHLYAAEQARDRAQRSLRALQEGAALALSQLGTDGDGPVADFLCAILQEAVRGLLASDDVTNEAAKAAD